MLNMLRWEEVPQSSIAGNSHLKRKWYLKKIITPWRSEVVGSLRKFEDVYDFWVLRPWQGQPRQWVDMYTSTTERPPDYLTSTATPLDEVQAVSLAIYQLTKEQA